MEEKLPPPSPEEQDATLDRERVTRRTFLMKIGILLNGAVAVLVAIPLVRYLAGALVGKDGYLRWTEVGSVDQFHPGETTLVDFRNPISLPWDGDTSKIPAYVRREGNEKFTVFAINCAHLGCPVRWFPESQLFMCPCHGGVYYADGSRASGPPERGLFTYNTRIENGKLLIDAGQIPTFSTRAKLIQDIKPCPGTNNPGTGDSTIG